MQRLWQGSTGFWEPGLWASCSGRDVLEVDAGAGGETANDLLISVQGDSLLFPPAALVMGTNELKKLPPMQLESV